MKEFEVIKKYLMTYSGIHYRKPINEYDEMMKIKVMGQNAVKNFNELGEDIIKRISGFNIYRKSKWLSTNQIIPNYLWIQFKKDGFEKYPSSISLAAKKVKEKFYFYVAVEIKNIEAEKRDFNKHNKILELPLLNNEVYYSGNNDDYFNIGRDKNIVKIMIEKKLIEKVRIQRNINQPCKMIKEEIIDNIVESFKILEPYYNEIIQSY